MAQNKDNNSISGFRLFWGSLNLIFLALTLAIALAIWNIPLYEHVIVKFNLPEVVNLSKDKILENYLVMLKYLHFPWIKELNMPDFPSSVSGAFHFSEVKKLYYLEYIILFISLIYSIIFLHNLRKSQNTYRLKNIFKYLAIVPPVFLILIAISFDKFFVNFHKLFFNNNAWLFNPQTDPVILILPEEFFMYCFIEVFLIIELAMLILYWIGKSAENKLKRSKTSGSK